MATASAPTTWTVVREILSSNTNLTADEVLTKAKAKGVKVADEVLRRTVYDVRKEMKKKAARLAAAAPAAKPAPTPTPAPKVTPTPKPAAAAKPAPKATVAPKLKPTPQRATAAARKTAGPTTSSVVRSILSGDLNLTADQVVAKAKARGLRAAESSIRALVYNIRGELNRAKAKAPRVVASAAQKTAAPAPAPAPVAPTPAAPAPAGLTHVLSNVALVNAAVAASGGVERAKQVAEAVRACGGSDAFTQYLDLVAGIRTDAPAAK
jgi:hypothetical protein